jgi:hypothetical protein
MQEGLKQAVAVPLSLAERVNLLWPCLKEMVIYGNVACKSDLQVLYEGRFYSDRNHEQSPCLWTLHCNFASIPE